MPDPAPLPLRGAPQHWPYLSRIPFHLDTEIRLVLDAAVARGQGLALREIRRVERAL